MAALASNFKGFKGRVFVLSGGGGVIRREGWEVGQDRVVQGADEMPNELFEILQNTGA